MPTPVRGYIVDEGGVKRVIMESSSSKESYENPRVSDGIAQVEGTVTDTEQVINNESSVTVVSALSREGMQGNDGGEIMNDADNIRGNKYDKEQEVLGDRKEGGGERDDQVDGGEECSSLNVRKVLKSKSLSSFESRNNETNVLIVGEGLEEIGGVNLVKDKYLFTKNSNDESGVVEDTEEVKDDVEVNSSCSDVKSPDEIGDDDSPFVDEKESLGNEDTDEEMSIANESKLSLSQASDTKENTFVASLNKEGARSSYLKNAYRTLTIDGQNTKNMSVGKKMIILNCLLQHDKIVKVKNSLKELLKKFGKDNGKKRKLYTAAQSRRLTRKRTAVKGLQNADLKISGSPGSTYASLISPHWVYAYRYMKVVNSKEDNHEGMLLNYKVFHVKKEHKKNIRFGGLVGYLKWMK